MLWQFADEIGKCAKIVVGERLRHLVHGVEQPQLLAKHEKLDQRIWRLLATERGRIFGRGLPVFAMTGKTGRGALFDGFGSDRPGQQRKRQSCSQTTHPRVLRWLIVSSSLRGAKRPSNPDFLKVWIASLSLSSGAALRRPVGSQ